MTLAFADEVEKQADFLTVDEFLTSLFEGDPDTLEPGQKSVEYSWSLSWDDMGLEGVPYVELYGIMPHMHELGRKYRFRFRQEDGDEICLADVQDWDFNWQRMYFYNEPVKFKPGMSLELTCEYNTENQVEPVMPGWGTQNEMCVAIMYVVIPPGDAQ